MCTRQRASISIHKGEWKKGLKEPLERPQHHNVNYVNVEHLFRKLRKAINRFAHRNKQVLKFQVSKP